MDEKEQLIYYKQTGDLQALGKLYAPYMSLLYGVCFKYFQEQAASQDAVMQIFEQLVHKLRVHEVDNFKSWLYVFARNYCLMELRKQKGKMYVDIEDNMSESEQKLVMEDEGKWTEDDFDKVHECLASLSTDQAVCVRLFYLEQKCYKDIAEETGYDLNKVKSYIQNGKRNLKICMESGKNGK
ncbi:sigma-70 family RNA polymerase sigma factor [Sphingobacterium phlebotomi]|uniref:Sigma-70 family RNA polymerase sigma factor n=1 Tax=Sphingobacterium phlebotomi TaxID=2605433 RepID=A0A5D4H1W1_9SPHI|nr:sigma-70 family RNA polymerase sigma factor [Sphingobacterium phlebotomi]TYR34484.1 sigma-70 family RNA polymerase sigma factor [Sphingobacterium phlebotomi]